MSFFTDLFEPIGRKTLKEISLKVEGDFIQGNLREKDKIIIPYRNTQIIIDTYKRFVGKRFVLYFRIICPFKSINNLTMSISTEDSFSHAAKVFGYEDITVGNKKFDNEFYLQSNDKQLFLEFIKSDTLQKHYLESLKKLSYSSFSIEVRSDTLGSSDYCVYNESSLFYVETFLEYLTLCKLTLDRLIEIGEAEDIDPNMQ